MLPPGHHHSLTDNCSNYEHVDWAWDIFHECVLDKMQYAGFIIGLLSILCWIFVFVPQFIESFKTGRMDEAVSPFFLISWLFGDLSNLIGCILTHQLGTQLATAYYFIVMDSLIIMQYFYYVIKNRRRRRRTLLAANGDAGPKDYATITPRTDQNHVIYCVGGLFLFSYLFSVQSFGSSTMLKPESRSVGRSLLEVSTDSPLGPPDEVCKVYFADTGDCLFKDEIEVIGYSIGSLSGMFYLGSRLPQLIKNFQRKSVEGLSIMMFILTVLGNVFYGMSILMQDTELIFLVAHLPWLVGSIGTLIFDVCMLIQFALYGRNRQAIPVEDDEARRLLTPSLTPSASSGAIYS